MVDPHVVPHTTANLTVPAGLEKLFTKAWQSAGRQMICPTAIELLRSIVRSDAPGPEEREQDGQRLHDAERQLHHLLLG